jgi:hypothetical protein
MADVERSQPTGVVAQQLREQDQILTIRECRTTDGCSANGRKASADWSKKLAVATGRSG